MENPIILSRRVPFWQRRSFKRDLTGWLCAAPIMVYFSTWVFGPIIASLTMSLFDWDGFAPLTHASFIGLGNARELFRDETFAAAFFNTTTYAIVVVASRVVLGLGLALALNGVTRFVGLVRSIYYLPVVLPATAMALLWSLMYQPRYGLLNQILGFLRLSPVAWLLDPGVALYSVSAMVIWKGLGWNMVVFLAGLKAIPIEFYEAAEIDGANGWYRFWRITMPLLKPTLLFVLVTAVIQSMQVFTPVYMLTQGGPANHTNVVVYWMYKTAFQFSRFSYAASMGVALFTLILVITIIQMRVLREGGLTSYYR